jgi:peptidoglycan/LPS O-acetylase OafA/YrhL
MIETLPLKKKRILGLDLMRAIAILLVIFHHGFTLFTFPFIPLPDGVDIFFVLSGFLIGGILIKSMEKSKGFSLNDLKIFWFRRWFRTLPAFWFTLIVNLILYFCINLQTQSLKETIKLMVLKEKLWQFFFFVQNLFANLSTRFFSESWSLSVEEWFYLLLPIILFFALKSRIVPYKAVLLSILIIIVFPTIARYFFSDIHLKWTWLSTRMVVIMRLDSIGLGVLMAYLKYYKSAIWDKMAKFKLLIVLGIAIFYGSFYIVHENYYYFNSITLTNLFFYTFTSFGVMITLPALSKMTSNNGIFERAITFVSLISYSMYLINYSIVIVLIQIFTPANVSEMGKFISFVLYWIITIGLSALMYEYIEEPFMALRDKYFMG